MSCTFWLKPITPSPTSVWVIPWQQSQQDTYLEYKGTLERKQLDTKTKTHQKALLSHIKKAFSAPDLNVTHSKLSHWPTKGYISSILLSWSGRSSKTNVIWLWEKELRKRLMFSKCLWVIYILSLPILWWFHLCRQKPFILTKKKILHETN